MGLVLDEEKENKIDRGGLNEYVKEGAKREYLS